MRISLSNFSTLYNKSMIQKNQDQAGITASQSPKNNYDEVSIRSASLESLDSNFVDALKTALMKEVRIPASETKLDGLKQKVEDGTYQVDANKIAERILLYKGEDFYE